MSRSSRTCVMSGKQADFLFERAPRWRTTVCAGATSSEIVVAGAHIERSLAVLRQLLFGNIHSAGKSSRPGSWVRAWPSATKSAWLFSGRRSGAALPGRCPAARKMQVACRALGHGLPQQAVEKVWWR